MTIGIGILASDGIVIAADSQTTSDIKGWHGKMSAIVLRDIEEAPDGSAVFTHEGGCVVTIAGSPSGYAFRAAELMIQVFDDNRALKGEPLRAVFESELGKFYLEHVVPYSGLPQQERPTIQLMIGVCREGKRDLWYSENAILMSGSPYHVIGIGQTQADPLVGHLWRIPRPSLVEAIFLAAFVVHQTKEVNPYCGKTSDIICLRKNMFLPVRRSFIAQIDRVFSDHQDVLVSAGIWGSLSMLRPKDKEAIAKARRRLKKIEISIRTECLFEKPEGKSPVTSRKATSR